MSHVVSVTRGGRVRRSSGNSNGSSLHGTSSKPTWRVCCCSALPTSRSRCGPGDLGGGSDGTSSMRVMRGFTTTVRWPDQKAARRSCRKKRVISGMQPVCKGARLCSGSNASDSREPNAVGLLRARPYIPHSARFSLRETASLETSPRGGRLNPWAAREPVCALSYYRAVS